MSTAIIFGTHKIMSDWLYFRDIFLNGGLISLWSRRFTIFQSRIQSRTQILKRQLHAKIRKGDKLCQF